MLVKKSPPITLNPMRNYQKELDYLYARRSVIDTLIQSLVEYDRHRIKRVDDRKQQMA
jgi:hypothetical protein